MRKIIWIPLVLLVAIAVGYRYIALPPVLPDRYIISADNILTMDRTNRVAEAILVERGIINAIGTVEELKQQANVKVYRHQGVLTPGLVEPHTHPIAAALLGAAVDIRSFKHSRREEIMGVLRDALDKTALTPWLIAYGWDPVALRDLKPPTRQELDELAPDRPVLILTQMLHDAYVNTAAIKAAGIELEGSLLHETDAVNSVISKIPLPDEAVAELLVRRQFVQYAKAGFTTIGITGAVGRHRDPVGLLKNISSQDRSPLRSFVYLLEEHLGRYGIEGDEKFAIVGAKFWVDGSPFTGGAATAEPYESNEFVNNHLNIKSNKLAPLQIKPEELIEKIEGLHKNGFQIALHVQGERAIDTALNAIEAIQAKHPKPNLNHRLEHNALITPEQIKRAARLRVSLGFFVEHIYFYGHVLPDLFGTERSNRYMPVGTAFASGVLTTLHGDHPATPINPLQTLNTAINRTSRTGNFVTAPDQALSPVQALKAMTINAARQLGQHKNIGSIEVGKQADFTLFSANPLTENLSDIKALQTWKAGQPVDQRMISWLKPSLVIKALISLI